jgi:hypothetical protein
MIDADVLENTQGATSFGVTLHPVAMVLVLLYHILYYYYSKKKTREKAEHVQNIFPVMTSLPVISGHVTDVTSGHVTSGSCTTSLHHLKYGLNRTDILLTDLFPFK